MPWSKQTRAFRNPRPGKATIVAEGPVASAVDAAYVNASYGHGFEYDDFFGNAHPGCAVVPAAFAMAEELEPRSEGAITALVVGYETYVRIGKWGSPAVLNEGWQPHAVWGDFGAAALAAKMYGLNEEQCFHALAIALSHASGPTEYASSGGSIKRVHAGIVVRNGIESAELARAGITGPRRLSHWQPRTLPHVLRQDGRGRGDRRFPARRAQFHAGLQLQGLLLLRCTFSYIEAMAHVRDRADEIERIEARVQTMVNSIVGARNANIYNPRNIEEVQYSFPRKWPCQSSAKVTVSRRIRRSWKARSTSLPIPRS